MSDDSTINQSLPDLDISQRVYLLSILLEKEQRKSRTNDVYEQSTIVFRNPGLGSFAKVLNHIVILLSRGTVAEANLTVAASAGPLRADGGHVMITYHRCVRPFKITGIPSFCDMSQSRLASFVERHYYLFLNASQRISF